ncbi:MAG: hypothetical protein F6K32_14760 [Desertifilum sp. SIO1I2]|nr:hypothetical protein [Desertifilum sp. SIO1I2]
MLTQDFLIVTISLGLSGFWLFSKGVGFRFLPKIEDEKGILLPSFVFLISPFIALSFWSFMATEKIEEIIKPLVPLATFLLGQALTKKEKYKEEKNKEIDIAILLIFELNEIIELLHTIEIALMTGNKHGDEINNSSKLKSCYQVVKPKIEKIYSGLRLNLEFLKFDIGINSLFYIKKIKDHLEFVNSNAPITGHRLSELSDIRIFKVEVYENIIRVSQKPSLKNTFIFSYFKNCIYKLEQEHERLIRLEEGHASIQEFWKNKPQIEIDKHPEVDLYYAYDINTERDAIEEIKRVFERCGISKSWV